MAWEPPFKPGFVQWTPPDYLNPGADRRQPSFDSPAYGTGPIIDVTPQETTDATPLVPLTPQRLTLDQVQFQRYSQIIPWKVVEYKLTPQTLTPTSDVPMDWVFDEPQHDEDNELRVYVSLSPEDVAIIKRKGYHHYVIQKDAKVFEAADITVLEELQQREIEMTPYPEARAFLQIEHKQQLVWAQEQKYDLTILDFLASPFRRNFQDRYQATLAQRSINSALSNFKGMLYKNRDD